MVRCPQTAEPVFTGIATGITTDLNRYKNQTFPCPACNQLHTWSGADAFFEE